MKDTYINNASLCKMKAKGKKIMRMAPVKANHKQKIITIPPVIIARPFFDLQPFFQL